VNWKEPLAETVRLLPELICSTKPEPRTPVTWPPTVYPPPTWQALAAKAAVVAKIPHLTLLCTEISPFSHRSRC